MKKLAIIFLILTACSSPRKSMEKKVVESPSGVVKGSTFNLRPYKLIKMENGLKVYFIEDKSLPRVSLQMLVKVGLREEAAGLDGINSLTVNLFEQGTQKRTATTIADEFGDLGTELNTSPAPDFTLLSLDALSKDKDRALDLFSDVVLNPAFKDNEVERVRSQMLAQIQKKSDNPSGFADDQFDQFLYGSHPYAKDSMGSSKSVRKITKAEIIKHYLSWYRPNNSILAVVGNYSEDFQKQVLATFGKWISRPIKPTVTHDTPDIGSSQTLLISKAGLKQTQIRIGRPGVERKNPDFLILRAANEILGGGMSSRLMQKVRDELGLTYGVSSAFDFRKERGSFEISTFTKNESALQTLQESIKVYNEFVEKGVNEAELTAAKAQMVAQLPRALETADRYAYNLLVLDYYDIPFSYLTDYMANVEKISAYEVNQAIKKYLPADQLKILIYGDEKAISKQLESFRPEIQRL